MRRHVALPLALSLSLGCVGEHSDLVRRHRRHPPFPLGHVGSGPNTYKGLPLALVSRRNQW